MTTRVLLVSAAALACFSAHAEAQVNPWQSVSGTTWLTNSLWGLGHAPTATEIAQFGLNPPAGTVGSDTGVGISYVNSTINNNGAFNQIVGGIWVTSARPNNLNIRNQTTANGGFLTFAGATIDGVPNTFVYHNGGAIGAETTLRFNNVVAGTGSGAGSLNLQFATDGILRTKTGNGLAGDSATNTIHIDCWTLAGDRHITFHGGGNAGNRGGTLLLGSAGAHSFNHLTIGAADGSEAGLVDAAGNCTINGTLTVNPNSQIRGFFGAGSIVLKSMGLSSATQSMVSPGGLRGTGGFSNVQLQANSGIHAEGAMTATGSITQSGGTFSLTKTGPGDLKLTQPCTYGDTHLLEGSISIDEGNNRLPTASGLTIASGASLILGATSGAATTARSQTLRSLSGAGSVVGIATANSTLTLSTGSSTFTGLLGGTGTNQNRIALNVNTGAFLDLARPAGNTYLGNTSITGNASLRVSNTSGSATGTGNVSIAAGSTLEGLGSFTGNLTGNGIIAPGTSTARGVLTVGNTTLSSTASLALDLLSATNYDALSVLGTVSLGNAALVLSIDPGLIPGTSDRFWIFRNDGTDGISGTFAGLPQGSRIFFPGGLEGTLHYSANFGTGALTGGNDIVIAIPAPGAPVLLGFAAVALRRRRTR